MTLLIAYCLLSWKQMSFDNRYADVKKTRNKFINVRFYVDQFELDYNGKFVEFCQKC